MVVKKVDVPDRMYVEVPGLSAKDAHDLSAVAVAVAKQHSPKLSGKAARGIAMYYGSGFFGFRWRSPYLWYQDRGTKPYVMRALAGKTIPMWLEDPTGKISRENPKAKTRVVSGRRQTLIFRRAAKMGQRKQVRQRTRGGVVVREVPMSYPGAPGRIARRDGQGRIYSHHSNQHSGLRWRNPGLKPREFFEFAIREACLRKGIPHHRVHAVYGRR